MKRVLVIAGMMGAFVLGMSTPALTFWDFPHMRSARNHLFAAREELRQASGIPMGRRERALEHTNKAIEECDRAIEDRR
jgi:hypothetical protein